MNTPQNPNENPHAIAVYKNVSEPLVFIREMGSAFTKSQMFGCNSEPQGQVLAMACITSGTDPLSLIRKYHLVSGNVSMRAEAMLAGFNERGGIHKILSRTSEFASVELTYQDQSNVFSLTFEEAKAEPFCWKKDKADKTGNTKIISDNYATPRKRTQM